MLDSFFNEELRELETRHREYLAHFINVYCDPDSTIVGILPTAGRENSVLPSIYAQLRHNDEIGMAQSVGGSQLFADNETLSVQFDRFGRHFSVYPQDIARFVQFHTHRQVAPGFYNASDTKETTAGVPEFIEEFFSAHPENVRIASGKIDPDNFKRAFSIFQRGFTYAHAAAASDAKYLTHPIRWSCAGFGTPRVEMSAFAHILGGIIATVIEDHVIRTPRDLYLRLRSLRESASEWRGQALDLELAVQYASSAEERESHVAKLKQLLSSTAAGWFGGQLSDKAGEKLIAVTSALVGVAVGLLLGSRSAGVLV